MKYLCVKKCFVNNQLIEEGQEVSFETPVDSPYLKPIDVPVEVIKKPKKGKQDLINDEDFDTILRT